MAIPFSRRPTPQQQRSDRLRAAAEAGGQSTIMQHLTGLGAVEQYRQGGYKESLDLFRRQKIELRKAQKKQEIEIKKDLARQIERIQELKYRHGEIEAKLHRAQARKDEAGAARLQERLDQARALAKKHIEPLERHTWENFELANREQFKDIKMAHRDRLREASRQLHEEVRKRNMRSPSLGSPERPAPFSLPR